MQEVQSCLCDLWLDPFRSAQYAVLICSRYMLNGPKRIARSAGSQERPLSLHLSLSSPGQSVELQTHCALGRVTLGSRLVRGTLTVLLSPFAATDDDLDDYE